MKIKILSVLCFAAFLAACGGKTNKVEEPVKTAKAPAVVEPAPEPVVAVSKSTYTAAIADNQSCNVDSDCTAVPAGCCLCDGQAAVNEDAKDDLLDLRAQACNRAICTMQMCYMDIDVFCNKNKKCEGKLKEDRFPFPIK